VVVGLKSEEGKPWVVFRIPGPALCLPEGGSVRSKLKQPTGPLTELKESLDN
jgi:hypothetical protein